MSISRRQFLGRTSAVIVAGSMAAGKVFGANERVNMAVIGFNGRGRSHIAAWSDPKHPSQVVALCDVDTSVYDRGLQIIARNGGKKPKLYTDLRKMIEDKDIDAVSVATPHHWHVPAAVWSMQAGKDVYVEKPCSHNIWESRQLVNAATKYKRICQHGTQIRSSVAIREAMDHLHHGLIGEVYMARGLCYKRRLSIGHGKPASPPSTLNYDLWQGPAPAQPYLAMEGGSPPAVGSSRIGGLFIHYNWHWFWDYGNGDLGNQGVHQMDLARWGLGVTTPTKIMSMGGHFIFDDAKQIPNLTTSSYFFPDAGPHGRMLVFEVRPFLSNNEDGVTIGDLFYGTKGMMIIDSYSRYRTILCDEDGKNQRPGPTGNQGGDHFGNFLDAVRARDPKILHAPILEGHYTALLCHMGLISARIGRSLEFDPEKEEFINDDEANKYVKPPYRKGFEVPEITL